MRLYSQSPSVPTDRTFNTKMWVVKTCDKRTPAVDALRTRCSAKNLTGSPHDKQAMRHRLGTPPYATELTSEM